MKVVQSTCNYCSIACNVDFHVEDDHIVKVVPTVGYPVNNGFCCIKGLNLDKQNTKYHNPVLPLLRDEEGNMNQISWMKLLSILQRGLMKFKISMVKKVLHLLVQVNLLQRKWHL